MKGKYKKFLLPVGFILLVSLIFLASRIDRVQYTFVSVKNMMASAFFVDSITEKDILARYETAKSGDKPVKIIIVAGHEDDLPGAVYKNRREADMTVQLAEKLAGFLLTDPEFKTTLTRTSAGYNPLFWDYREKEKDSILNFVKSKKQDMTELIQANSVYKSVGVKHNTAPDDMVTTLYGINKWADELKADIVIHIHFNDAAGRKHETPYDYSGFSIYIPEKQYSNARASRAVAKPILDRLSRFYPTSDLPKEDTGLVESQDLIAVGAYNTLDPVGMLIEYGYIYEPQFDTAEVRNKTITELAWQTYLGLNDFFKTAKSKNLASVGSLGSLNQPIEKNSYDKGSVLDLQKAFLLINAYPPQNKTLRQCPLTGNFGECTTAAISFFQSHENISGEKGRAGQKTLESLRGRLSSLGL